MTGTRSPLTPIFRNARRQGFIDVGNTPPSPAMDPPVACFTWSIISSGTAAFDASCSTDTDGTIVGWNWDFGDGNTSTTGPTVTHTYGAVGIYTVSLTVTDNDGLVSTVFSSQVEIIFITIDWFQQSSGFGDYTVLLSPLAGELLIALYCRRGGPLTLPTGFTALDSGSVAGTTGYVVGWKIALGTETSFAFGGGLTGERVVGIMRISGIDTTTPIDVTSTTGAVTRPASTLPMVAPSVTTSGPRLIVQWLFPRASGTGVYTPTPNSGQISLSGRTQGVSPTSATAWAGWLFQPAAGPSGTMSVTPPSSTSDFATGLIAAVPI